MDRDLLKILAIIAFVIIFGSWQGLYNLGVVTWFYVGLIAFILITFFKKDLIIAGLKTIFKNYTLKRRR
jgi:Flp pilus assembly pilin Flp